MDLSFEGVDTIVADFGAKPTQVTKAMVRALNRSIKSGQTVMVREMARDTGLKSKDVRGAMRLQEASASKPEASLGASLRRLPLITFGARGPEPSFGRGRGVSYKLPGGRGRVATGFIATMRSGHRGVYVRNTKARLTIRELFGPSLGRVFARFRPAGVARVREVFASNFAHEMDFATSQGGASAGTD